jgi:hypothetical protein
MMRLPAITCHLSVARVNARASRRIAKVPVVPVPLQGVLPKQPMLTSSAVRGGFHDKFWAYILVSRTGTVEDKIIIAEQRSGPAGTYVKVRFDGPRGRWEGRSIELTIVVRPTYVLFPESRLWTRMVTIIRISNRLEIEFCALRRQVENV